MVWQCKQTKRRRFSTCDQMKHVNIIVMSIWWPKGVSLKQLRTSINQSSASVRSIKRLCVRMDGHPCAREYNCGPAISIRVHWEYYILVFPTIGHYRVHSIYTHFISIFSRWFNRQSLAQHEQRTLSRIRHAFTERPRLIMLACPIHQLYQEYVLNSFTQPRISLMNGYAQRATKRWRTRGPRGETTSRREMYLQPNASANTKMRWKNFFVRGSTSFQYEEKE